MCGIAGILVNNKTELSIDAVKKMTDSLIHRGPDGEGQWLNAAKKVALGHRRLSILDLSEAGKQPMHYLERYSITFNGEIYNYIEIRDQLIKKGYLFHTGTDTEVLLALYDLKKEAALDDLDGMFALAIWDEQEQKLFCARDRFGEKPFHYFWDGEQFVFASEIKAIFAYGIEQKISKPILQDFLNRYIIERGTETFFEGILKLPHSHYLTIQKGKLTVTKYYELDLNKKTVKANDEDYAKGFKDLFTTSLLRRMRSDVPVGSSLSGGLDSSTVVCFMRKELGDKALQKSFSARFKGPKDEGEWIKLASDRAHTEHHEVYPDPEQIVRDISDMVYHNEYPFGSASICAMWYVMKLVKENGVTVLLDGQGADEYLSGYPIFKNYLLMQHLFHLQFGKFARARKGYRKIYGSQYPLGKMLWAHPVLLLFKHPKGAFYNARTFKQRLKYETFHRLQELLAYVDRNAMAFSIEVRLPFLYHELVEYTMSLPDEQLYHDGITKYVLRNAIKGVVPDEIVNRYDKIGYEPPQDVWMKQLYEQNKVEETLKTDGYTAGPDAWRNYIASVFLKRFTA